MSFRIVHTIPGLKTGAGGVARSVPGLCTALSVAGAQPVLISQYDRNSAGKSAMLPDASLVRTRLIEGYDWERLRFSYTPGLGRALQEECRQPCVLHDHGMWLHLNHVAAAVTRRLRVKRVVSPRGMLDGWALSFRSWKKRAAWRLYQYRDLATASAFSTTSEAEAASVRALGFLQPIAVIPNGIAVPQDFDRAVAVDRTRTVLFLSRIHPKKGLLDLIRAWASIKSNTWRLVIAGADEIGHFAQVQEAARTAGVESTIDFVGHVEGERKQQLYRDADLFVLPSYSENFGIVIGEALSYAVPVIATRATPWEELQTRSCGWWVPTGAESIAQALVAAMNLTDEQRMSMGARGRTLIAERYSWQFVARRHIEFYEWLMHGASRPSCLYEQ